MKMKTLKQLIILSFFGASSSSFALDLIEAYQRAEKMDPQWQANQLKYEIDQLNLGLAKGNLLPTVSLSGSLQRQNQSLPEPQQGTSSFLMSPTTTRQIAITARQPLFRWDAWQGYKQVATSVQLSEVNLKLQKQQHTLQVAEAYFNVLRQQALTVAYVQEEKALSAQLKVMQAKLKEGLVARSDVSEASAQYQNTQVNRLATQVQLLLAQEKLAQYIGEYREPLAVIGDDFQYQAPLPNDLTAWLTLAEQKNLAVTQARLEKVYAQDAKRVEQAAIYPQVEAIASYGHVKQTPETVMSTNGDFDQIGVEVNWNLFTGGRTQTKIKQATLQIQQADAQLNAALKQAKTDVKQAYLQVETDDAKLKARLVALASAELVARASEAQYREGLKNMVDVLLAQRNAFSAKTDYLQTKYDYFLHVLQLKAAVGQLTEQDIRELNAWLRPSDNAENIVMKPSS